MGQGTVFALDLGQRTGFAVGEPGACPRSGAVLLKRKDEHRSVALSNLIAFLAEQWGAQSPALVAKESPLPLQAFADRGNSEAAVMMAYGLHGIVEGMCVRFGARLVAGHPSTIRKHFLGVGRLGSRQDTKAAVVDRCRVMRLLPADCRDDDRADAIAVHDWACATFANRAVSTTRLHLFGERPR